MSLIDAFSSELTAVKGMRDLVPAETEKWALVEQICREVFSSYGYGEIRTPIVEFESLFARTVGDSTDIVSKEMFAFKDRKGRRLALRPENTAGVVRAIIERRLTQAPMPLRLWYAGPQFRYERPQKSRYREFRQLGAELFGVAGPSGEAELLKMLFDFLGRLGFSGLRVRLNCIGTGNARQSFIEALRLHLLPYADRFTEDDQRRLLSNPLRLFDSKDPMTKSALQAAPKALDYLDPKTAEDFSTLQTFLSDLNIKFDIDPNLVRGLDYYTTTVFEVVSETLGAQNAILGGGRYDNLVHQLGGPHLAAAGFAIGEDRLIEAAPLKNVQRRWLVVVIPRSTLEFDYALEVADLVRRTGIGVVETDLSGRGFEKGLFRVKKIYEDANIQEWLNSFDFEHIYAILIGPDEKTGSQATVKNFESGKQVTIPLGELPHYFQNSSV